MATLVCADRKETIQKSLDERITFRSRRATGAETTPGTAAVKNYDSSEGNTEVQPSNAHKKMSGK